MTIPRSGGLRSGYAGLRKWPLADRARKECSVNSFMNRGRVVAIFTLGRRSLGRAVEIPVRLEPHPELGGRRQHP